MMNRRGFCQIIPSALAALTVVSHAGHKANRFRRVYESPEQFRREHPEYLIQGWYCENEYTGAPYVKGHRYAVDHNTRQGHLVGGL